MNSYGKRIVDLTLAGNALQVVEPGTPISSLTVLDLPAGASLQLQVGQQEAVPLQAGDRLDACPPITQGIYATFPAQPNVKAVIFVGFAGISATRGA